ncbi:unnamed protein product [Urochloa humidicola]
MATCPTPFEDEQEAGRVEAPTSSPSVCVQLRREVEAACSAAETGCPCQLPRAAASSRGRGGGLVQSCLHLTRSGLRHPRPRARGRTASTHLVGTRLARGPHRSATAQAAGAGSLARPPRHGLLPTCKPLPPPLARCWPHTRRGDPADLLPGPVASALDSASAPRWGQATGSAVGEPA